MKILINFEESATVRRAFEKYGHEVWSCDLKDSKHPGNHIKGDAIEALTFKDWDLMIAHPPCTYLCVTANKWLKDQPPRKSGKLVGGARREAVNDSIQLFMKIAHARIPRICIENPVGVMSTAWREPDQIIQPYDFGHVEPKKTCLWLKNLPLLRPTKTVEPEYHIQKNGKRIGKWFALLSQKLDRAEIRSKTFQGIADAMADQWGSPGKVDLISNDIFNISDFF